MVVLEQVREVVSAWEEARRRHADTFALANHRVHAAERRVTRALHGIPLNRWETIADGRASLSDPRLAREVHLATKSKYEVEAALAALAEARSARDDDCRRSRLELDATIGRIRSYSKLGERLTGYSAAGLVGLADDPIATRVQGDRRREIDQVTTRETVRDCQRRIAQLDAAHARAQAQLAAARRKRSDILAAQDEQVVAAERELNKAVVAMAVEMGTELAANLTGLKVSEVQRLVRRQT